MDVQRSDDTRVDGTIWTQLRWPPYPYPGLRPFRITDDADESLIFYGRDTHKDDILERLNSSQFVSVVGPSGCGKSSLVKVGVIPALGAGLLTRAGYDWLTLEMRPGRNPLRSLATALASLGGDYNSALGTPTEQVLNALQIERSALWLLMEHVVPSLGREGAAKKSRCLLLLLDQFEEVFTIAHDNREVDQFLGLIAQFFRKPHPRLYVLLTMRTDFISQCANFPGMAEILNKTQYITPVLRGEDLRDAIMRPADVYRGPLDPDLASEIIRDMGAGSTYDADNLPLMQHALLWLWLRRCERERIAAPTSSPGPIGGASPQADVEAYRDCGRLAGILERHAEEIFASLRTPGDKEGRRVRIAEVMFRRLSERDESLRYRRAPAQASEVCKLAECSRSQLDDVIVPFREASLLELRCPEESDPLLDLSHETLIRQWKRLRAWVDDEAEKAAAFRTLAREAKKWDAKNRPRTLLKTDDDFDALESWWKTNVPTATWAARYRCADPTGTSLADAFPIVETFRDASKQAQRRLDNARRRRKAVVLGSAVLFIASMFGLQRWLFIRESNQRARMLVQQGHTALENRSQALALGIALEVLKGANGLSRVDEAKDLAVEALGHLHEQLEMHVNQNYPSADYSPDGNWLVTVSDNQLTFVNTRDGQRQQVASPPGVGSVRFARWNPTANALLIGSEQGMFILPIDPANPQSGDGTPPPRPIGSGSGFSRPTFSANGAYVFMAAPNGPVQMWNARTGEEIKIEGMPRSSQGFGWAAFAVSADGLRLASPTQGKIEIYDIKDGRAVKNNAEITPPKAVSSPQGTRRDAGPPSQIVPLAFDPTDANRLLVAWGNQALGSTAGIARISPNAGSTPERFKVPDGERPNRGVGQGTFSADGGLVALTYDDGTVRVWSPADVSLAQRPTSLREHAGNVVFARFSPDGQHLVSAGQDKTIRIWNLTPALPHGSTPPQGNDAIAKYARENLPKRIENDQASPVELTDDERAHLGILAATNDENTSGFLQQIKDALATLARKILPKRVEDNPASPPTNDENSSDFQPRI